MASRAPTPQQAVTVDVDVLVAGWLTIPRGYVFRPAGHALARAAGLVRGGGSLESPVLSFLVRHPTAGPIAIDTGLHPNALASVRGDYGPLLSLIFRTLRPVGEPYDEQLRALGVEPADVRLAVMTHLHVDHTSGMRVLSAAEFVCADAEWATATGPRALVKGCAATHLPEAGRVRRIDFDGEGEPWGPFARTLDLLGDDSIRLVSTPGHTPGHLSVLLRATGGRRVLVVGDAAYTLESIRTQTLPVFTANDRLCNRSLAEIREFMKSDPDAVVVPTHDPDAWRAV